MNRAKAHSRESGLMGHCIESGFVLIDENGAVSFLDDEATLMVVDASRRSNKTVASNFGRSARNKESTCERPAWKRLVSKTSGYNEIT